MRIYLLQVGELTRENNARRLEALLPKLDEVRKRKVLSAGTPQAKAAQLGAGLLLQKAVQDWQDREVHCGAARDECPDGVLCTVSGLFSELGEPLSLAYRYGEKGKPYFQNIPLFFSLSHSGEYVLCAVSRREVGADIQKLQPTDVLKVAKRFFSEPECLALERCAGAEEQRRLFFELWSRKEAYGKLTGAGAAAVLGENLGNGGAVQGIEWAETSPPSGYAAAVCTRIEGRHRPAGCSN